MSEESVREIESTPPAEPVPAAPESTPPAEPVAAAKKEYPFKVLPVFATSVRMARRNFPLFFLLVCMMVVPSLISQYVNQLLGMFAQSVLSSVATAFVSYAVVMDMNGSQPSFGACISYGFSSFWRVLGVSLFSGFAILAATMLLIVPGIIVALMFFVIVPVTVIEGVGLDAAMKRSRELTAGRKGDLFVLGMLVGVLIVPLAIAAVLIEPSSPELPIAVVSGLFGAFMPVVSAVVYVVLRQLREGTQVPELATAFARIRK
jgi:hypothetical protein